MMEFLAENLFALGQISISIVTAIIAFFVYKSTKTIGKLAQTRFIVEQIQNLNLLLLNDRELAEAIATPKSRDDHKVTDPSEYKKRRMIILQLQIGGAVYSGYKDGYMDKDLFDDYMNSLVHQWIAGYEDYTLSVIGNWSTSKFGRYLADKIRRSQT